MMWLLAPQERKEGAGVGYKLWVSFTTSFAAERRKWAVLGGGISKIIKIIKDLDIKDNLNIT